MSEETLSTLNRDCLIGQVAKYGKAWHFSLDAQGDEPNHYDGFIPVEDVVRRLFYWDIVKKPIYLNDAVDVGGFQVDQLTQIPDRWAITRSDTNDVFYVGTDVYEVHQYREWLLEGIQEIVAAADGQLGITSALLLKNGAVAAVQIELPEAIEFEGDVIRTFMLGSTSANGSIASTYQTGETRGICDNTLAAARSEGFANGTTWKVKHTTNSKWSADAARKAVGILVDQTAAAEARIRRMANTPVTDSQWAELVQDLFPAPAEDAKPVTITKYENRVSAIHDLYFDDPRVGHFKGSAWGAYQALSTYNLHIRPTRGTQRDERNAFAFINGDIDKFDNEVQRRIEGLVNA